MRRLVEQVARRVTRALESDLTESSYGDDDALTALDAASLSSGQTALSFAPPPEKKLCAAFGGFSLHAATRVRASDRKGLYRLCDYGARGALANSRCASSRMVASPTR